MSIYWNDGTSLYHYGIPGMKWGVRRWQNLDGSFNDEGKIRYGRVSKSDSKNAAEHIKQAFVKAAYYNDDSLNTALKKEISDIRTDSNVKLARDELIKRVKPYNDIYNDNEEQWKKLSAIALHLDINEGGTKGIDEFINAFIRDDVEYNTDLCYGYMLLYLNKNPIQFAETSHTLSLNYRKAVDAKTKSYLGKYTNERVKGNAGDMPLGRILSDAVIHDDINCLPPIDISEFFSPRRMDFEFENIKEAADIYRKKYGKIYS